ncbi:hypothetical protein BD560DRAFT_494339 [Blakeslea trispora]|nr:hypothetical protein BD560DRAFT_494339 [Blakeslea trispora]
MSKRIERLRQATVAYEVFEHSSTFSAPVDVNDPEFAHLRSLVDSEVTSFLVALLKNYLLALAINKKHLSKNGKIGSKKAAKLILTINSLKKNSKKIIDILNKHLSDTCSPEDCNKMKIDSLEIAIKKFENQDIAFSDFVTIWHQLFKTKQELVLLEEEEQRLLSNLEQKLYKLERAFKTAEPGHHALLMQQKNQSQCCKA